LLGYVVSCTGGMLFEKNVCVRMIHENLLHNWRRQSISSFRFKEKMMNVYIYREEKDCGHNKHYALFNEPLRDMAKEG